MATTPKKVDWKYEMFFNHWTVSVNVSRQSKTKKEVYEFAYYPPKHLMRLTCYKYYERDARGLFMINAIWNRGIDRNNPNNLKMKEVPKVPGMGEAVLKFMFDKLKFTPFDEAVDDVAKAIDAFKLPEMVSNRPKSKAKVAKSKQGSGTVSSKTAQKKGRTVASKPKSRVSRK